MKRNKDGKTQNNGNCTEKKERKNKEVEGNPSRFTETFDLIPKPI